MIYITLIRRYLIPYLGWSLAALIAFALTTWFSDGFLPTLAFMVLVSTIILGLPVLLYLDYREVKSHIKNVREISKGQGDASEYIEKAVGVVAGKTGIPEFLVGFFFDKSNAAIKRIRAK